MTLALLVLVFPHAASADAVPAILDVRLDDDNHAVITWRNVGSQTSNNVKWTTDGTLGATYRDGSYGTPLADCESAPRPNPSGDSQWLYGRSCKGDDVANAATRHVTREDFQVGVYYFQVTVAGKNIHETGASVSAVFHYSGVFKLTVTPAKEGGKDQPNIDDYFETIGEAVLTGKPTVHRGLKPGTPVTGPFEIKEQDYIVSGGSRAKIDFKDRNVLALDKRSGVSFSLEWAHQQSGRVWYSLKGRPRLFLKRVVAGQAGDVLNPRAATFTIQLMGDNRARIRVYSGTVTVMGNRPYGAPDVHVSVGPGLETLLAKGRVPTKPRKLTPEAPFWK